MILTPHILIGAAIGAKTQNLGLIIILGILSHFIMDKIPHWDYCNRGIKNFKKTKNIKAFLSDLFKIAIDGLIGLLIVFLIIWQVGLKLDYLPYILFGIFFSILPDIFLFIDYLFFPETISKKYVIFHHRFFHHPKDKQKEGKITFLGLATQILVVIIAIIIFFS